MEGPSSSTVITVPTQMFFRLRNRASSSMTQLTPRAMVPVAMPVVMPIPSSNMVRGSTPAPLNSSSWMPSPQIRVPSSTIRAWTSWAEKDLFIQSTSFS